ncbi:Solute carrier family 35 member E1-like protein [Diplonema papillatum]|nr:Solute carrier family 35 member E1-like protein [Diplonema papillatum]
MITAGPRPPKGVASGVVSAIVVWYACSVVGNVTSKMILQRFDHPVTLMMGPMLIGACSVPLIAALFPKKWASWILTGNSVSGESMFRYSASSLFHTASERKMLCFILGFFNLAAGLTHRMALSSVQVSFAHTVKAIQPLYACFFSFLTFGRCPTAASIFCLTVVMFGVVISVFNEGSGSFAGVVALQVSVACLSLSSVVQKLVLAGLDKAEVYCFITASAAIMNCFLWLLVDAYTLLSADSAFTGSFLSLAALIAVNSVALALQHFTSLTALQHLSPTSHSVVACMKRIVIITMSDILLHHRMNPVTAVGASLAVLGATAYERTAKQQRKAIDLEHKAEKDGMSPTHHRHEPAPHAFFQYLMSAGSRREALVV